jgi:hypothetical protein
MHKLVVYPDSPKRDAYVTVIMQKGLHIIPHIIEMLKTPSEDNCVLLFACSILFTIWAFGSIRLPAEANLFVSPEFTSSALSPLDLRNSSTSRLDDLLKVVNLSQGTRAIAMEMPTWLHTRGFGTFLTPPKYDELPPPPKYIAVALNSLEGHSKVHRIEHGTSAHAEEFLIQIHRLHEIFRCRQCPEWYDFVVGFAIRLPKSMVALLIERDPCAMVILAY